MWCSHLYLPQSSALREDTFLIFLVQGREESCRGLGQEEYDELEERMKRDLKYNFVKSILSMVSDTKKIQVWVILKLLWTVNLLWTTWTIYSRTPFGDWASWVMAFLQDKFLQVKFLGHKEHFKFWCTISDSSQKGYVILYPQWLVLCKPTTLSISTLNLCQYGMGRMISQ